MTKITTRPLTPQEAKQARKSHWTILLFLPICTLIGIVVLKVDLPELPKYVALLLLPAILLVFFRKQFQVEKDIKRGSVKVYEGRIVQKVKLGSGKSKGSSGISVSQSKPASSSSYLLKFKDQTLWVPAKIYAKAKVNTDVVIVTLPKSQMVLSLQES